MWTDQDPRRLKRHEEAAQGANTALGEITISTRWTGVLLLVLLGAGLAGSLWYVNRGHAKDASGYRTATQPAADDEIAEYTRQIDSGEGDAPLMAHRHISRGIAYATKGDKEKALADYNSALELDPEPDYLVIRADLHQELTHYREAIADYLQAEVLYRQRGDEEKARKALWNARRGVKRGEAMAYVLCIIVSFGVGSLFRKPATACRDRRSRIVSWTILVLSVTLLPYIAVWILRTFDCLLAFGHLGWVAFGYLFAVALGIGLLFLVIVSLRLAWDKLTARAEPSIPTPGATGAQCIPCTRGGIEADNAIVEAQCGRERTAPHDTARAEVRTAYEIAIERTSKQTTREAAATTPPRPGLPVAPEAPTAEPVPTQQPVRPRNWRNVVILVAAIAALLVGWLFSSEFRRHCCLAHLGFVRSQYMLGATYKSGTSLEQDYRKAAQWFKTSADGGFAPAAFEYGVLRFYGLGVAEDQESGFDYLWKAANADIAESQFLVGILLLDSPGKLADESESPEHWLRRAAEAGYAPAEYCLANEYIAGTRLPQNHVAADILLTDLVDSGFQPARELRNYLHSVLMTPQERTAAANILGKERRQL